ncbi:unnamed protein product [Brachionus calyciflorus]|uniref:Homeobox domain-containing protein n=1 Tax=Brachionus calyciflorus TaxID=104777 RepID=A0A814CF60_9BILA|nr:unnamed protein product [Brachionus calyciflorus]
MDRVVGNKKKRVKRLSSSSQIQYYPSAFITKPCDQLFGPTPFDYSILHFTDTGHKDKSFNNSLSNESQSDDLNPIENSFNCVCAPVDHQETLKNEGSITTEKFEYIPTPKWNKIQNAILEELFKKSRYPKPNELKILAQRFHVMDSDIEEWFRKRRGRDRKTKRKNEVLKTLIDNYLDK